MTLKKESIIAQLKQGKNITGNLLDGVRVPSLTIWSMLKTGIIKLVSPNTYKINDNENTIS